MGRTSWPGFALALLTACASHDPPPRVEEVPIGPPAEKAPPPPVPSAMPSDPGAIQLTVGAITTVDARNVRNFSVANSNVDVRLTPNGKKFLVAGRRPGRCDVVLFYRNGKQKILKFEVPDVGADHGPAPAGSATKP